jgi:flagellar motor switch protein FliM
MTIQPHDFSRPPSLHPETRAKLAQWLTRANTQLAEVIAGFSLQVEIQLEDCSTAWPFSTFQEWSEKALAYNVKLPDVSATSIIAIPNPLAQVLIGTLLGEQPTEWPEERDLTAGEESVGEFIVSRIVSNMIDAWPGDERIDVQVDAREPNLRRTKTFKFKEPLIVCRSTMTTPIGSAQWCWMLPHEFLTKLFGAVRASAPESTVSARQQLESLAREMTTQVTIRLGGVQLSPPQLAELRVGDLVVLNQKTGDPLRAMVSGKPRYLGWPGRVGSRQAFEIASEGPRRDRSAESAKDPAAVANR